MPYRRRLLLADAGDVQKFVHAQRLALDHLPEGGVAEHHISRDVLLCSETLAQSVERRQKLFVGPTEVGVGGSAAGRQSPGVGRSALFRGSGRSSSSCAFCSAKRQQEQLPHFSGAASPK